MNFFKSMYISSYLMVAMGIMGYAVWMLYQGADTIAWGGVFLTTAPIMMMIGRLMMFKSVARTSARFPIIMGLAVIGFIMSILAWSDNKVDILAPALAAIGLIGFLIYSYWYSSFGRKASDKIRVGDQLPDFTVLDTHNNSVSAKQLTARPAVLIFFRGNWCPLCVAQIKELVKQYDEIKYMGVRIAFISSQPHKNTIALAKKFGVELEFMTDEGNKAARILGIDNPHGLPMGMQMLGYDSETVMPTVIITDKGGRVEWTHETDNYRIRPEPSVYLEVLRNSGIIVPETE